MAGDINKCTTCPDSRPILSTIDSMCYASCDPPTFLDPISNMCKQCDPDSNCKTCRTTDLSRCSICDQYFPFIRPFSGKCY